MKNLKRQVRLGDMEYLTGQAFSVAGLKKLLINELTTMLLHCSDNQVQTLQRKEALPVHSPPLGHEYGTQPLYY